MRAVVVHGAGDLRVDERPDPIPGAGRGADRHGVGRGLRIRPVLLAARCARAPPCCGSPWCSATRWPAGSPAVGAGVTGQEIGQPVTVHPAELVGDGCLPERIAGRTNLYPRIRYFGSAAFDPHTDGGFSELRVVRADQVRPLPDGVEHRARGAGRAARRRAARGAPGR